MACQKKAAGKMKYDAAMDEYAKLIAAVDFDADIRTSRGLLFADRGRFTDGWADFRKCVEIEPENTLNWYASDACKPISATNGVTASTASCSWKNAIPGLARPMQLTLRRPVFCCLTTSIPPRYRLIFSIRPYHKTRRMNGRSCTRSGVSSPRALLGVDGTARGLPRTRPLPYIGNRD